MFVCQRCNKQCAAKTPSYLFPITIRQKVYPERRNKSGTVIDKGGTGYETVLEVRVCDACAATLAQHLANRQDIGRA